MSNGESSGYPESKSVGGPAASSPIADTVRNGSDTGDNDFENHVIKTSAAKFEGTSAYRDLLSFLTAHPEGVTVNKTLKKCPEISPFIAQQAKKGGRNFFSPRIFLSHLEGVYIRQIEGGFNRVFLLNQTSATPAKQHTAAPHDEATETSTAEVAEMAMLGPTDEATEVCSASSVDMALVAADGDELPATPAAAEVASPTPTNESTQVSSAAASEMAIEATKNEATEESRSLAPQNGTSEAGSTPPAEVATPATHSDKTGEGLASATEVVIPTPTNEAADVMSANLEMAGESAPLATEADMATAAAPTASQTPHDETTVISFASSTEMAMQATQNNDQPSNVAAAAAYGLLELLATRYYHNRPWPRQKRMLRRRLLCSLQQDVVSPSIRSWLFDNDNDNDNDISEKKRNNQAIGRVMDEFRKMGCVVGTNKALQWDAAKVAFLVENGGIAAELPGPAAATMATTLPWVSPPGSIPVHLIDTTDKLNSVRALFPFNTDDMPRNQQDCVVAVDCEGVPDDLLLVQVGTVSTTYVFDCVKLDAKDVCESLLPLLTCANITKLFHDLHNDAVAISRIVGGGDKAQPLCSTLDTQLAIEALCGGEVHIGFNKMLQYFGQVGHPLKNMFKKRMNQGYQLFSERPLSPDALTYASLEVQLLVQAKDRLFHEIGPLRDAIQRASDLRARLAPQSGGKRQICFDAAHGYSLSSFELLKELRPHDMQQPVPVTVSDDSHFLHDILPEDLRKHPLTDGKTHHLLCDSINLDKGREPIAWVEGKRVRLGSDYRLVSAQDIQGIVDKLGGFRDDNRARLDGQLNRISAIRNQKNDIIGLTLRVGRHVTGNAAMIADILGDPTKSILVLGNPGAGKTTLLREVTQQLSGQSNGVCVVDTNNEIAGDGDVPHPCTGTARRMMVQSLDKQGAVMMECINNHKPETLVIDHVVGTSTEVEAALACKQRGVRLIASAQGDLRGLVKNREMRELIGGIETITHVDFETEECIHKTRRSGSPAFDVIVELRRGQQNECRVVLDTGVAVDKVLLEQKYFVQTRRCDPQSGALSMVLDKF